VAEIKGKEQATIEAHLMVSRFSLEIFGGPKNFDHTNIEAVTTEVVRDQLLKQTVC
jgi:hypothetical protein